jgi:hypothetical protein
MASMLDAIRRWWPRRETGRHADLARWAAGQGGRFQARADGSALRIECDRPGEAWRLDWGPSQRRYLGSHELRLRAPLGEGDALHLAVMTRPLMQSLEAEIYDQYTGGLQTRADADTPHEMRWLVLYPRLAPAELGVLRDHFGAVGHPPQALRRWLDGALADALAMAATGGLADTALTLVVHRGRLTLRLPLAAPTPAACEAALALFGVARHTAAAAYAEASAAERAAGAAR